MFDILLLIITLVVGTVLGLMLFLFIAPMFLFKFED